MRVSQTSAFIVIFSVVLLISQTSGFKYWKRLKESVCKWHKNDAHTNNKCKSHCEQKWKFPRDDHSQAPFATGSCWSKKCVCKVSQEYKGYVRGFDKKMTICVFDKVCRSVFEKLQKHFQTHPNVHIGRHTTHTP
nr:PREDICTED: uncharacterized protein LOC109043122 [Bemisia tabaci]